MQACTKSIGTGRWEAYDADPSNDYEVTEEVSNPDIDGIRRIAVIVPDAWYFQTVTVPLQGAFTREILEPRTLRLVLPVLAGENKSWRKLAIDVLGSIGDERAIEAIINVVHDQDRQIGLKALSILSHIENEQAAKAFLDALHDQDPQIRRSAVGALASFHLTSWQVKALIDALQDQDADVRRSAAYGLRWTYEQAVEPLIKVLSDQDAHVRQIAAESLAFTHDKRAVKPLIALLQDPEQVVRLEVIEALGSLRVFRVRGALKAIRNKGDEREQEAAQKALKTNRDLVLEHSSVIQVIDLVAMLLMICFFIGLFVAAALKWTDLEFIRLSLIFSPSLPVAISLIIRLLKKEWWGMAWLLLMYPICFPIGVFGAAALGSQSLGAIMSLAYLALGLVYLYWFFTKDI